MLSRFTEKLLRYGAESGPTYSTLMAQSFNNLAEIYLTIGNLSAAMPVCQEAIEAWKKATESKGRGFVESLDHAAILHYFLGDYSQSKLFFKQAIDAWDPRAISRGYDQLCKNPQ